MEQRSANPGRGAPMGIEECSPSGGEPKRGRVGTECGIQYRSDNPDRGALVAIGELPSQADERGNGGIEHGTKQRSAKSRQRGLWSAYPSGAEPKQEELTVEGYRRE